MKTVWFVISKHLDGLTRHHLLMTNQNKQSLQPPIKHLPVKSGTVARRIIQNINHPIRFAHLVLPFKFKY